MKRLACILACLMIALPGWGEKLGDYDFSNKCQGGAAVIFDRGMHTRLPLC